MAEFRISIEYKNKRYYVPIKWLVHWIDTETDYTGLADFRKNCTDEDCMNIYKSAKREKIIIDEENNK